MTPTSSLVSVDLPEAFHPGWSRIAGLTIDGNRLVLDPQEYFFRRAEGVSWVICDWDAVRRDLVHTVTGTTDTTIEQVTLDYVREHGRRTSDPAEVLATAYEVYGYLFRPELLADPGLADVPPRMLRALREGATLMSLNRVELTGEISQVGPAWMIAAAAGVAFDFTAGEVEQLDELYHGTWFNEARASESVLAHAALGGRIVHGCQSAPNMSGGCVVQHGTNMARFRSDLAEFRTEWLTRVLGCA